MEVKKYFELINSIIDKIIRSSEMDISKMNEQEKQIISAFCFGVVNGYSLNNNISAVQIQSSMIAVLVQKFQYDSAVASQF
ncbi:MAG: Imm48 family immunity protein, partial [Eubacteriaceae bacterium]